MSVEAAHMGIPEGRSLRLLAALAVVNGVICMVAPAIVLARGSAQAPIGSMILWMAAIAFTLTPLQAGALWMVIGGPLKGLIRTHRLNRVIADVIDNRRLDIAFQPIVDLGSGKVLGAEALSRFQLDSAATPDVWFGRADEVGRGGDLELLAVRMALRAGLDLPGIPYIGVNVSPSTLADPRLLAVLLDSPIPPNRIVVEVTEHTEIESYENLAEPRQVLRSHGIHLAIDDAGSGYSSLQRIVALAPDIIKLDRALLSGVEYDKARQAMVAAIVMFALESGICVIAEGVETLAQLDALAGLGVDGAQGYFLGYPTTSPEEWRRWADPRPVSTKVAIRNSVYIIPSAS